VAAATVGDAVAERRCAMAGLNDCGAERWRAEVWARLGRGAGRRREAMACPRVGTVGRACSDRGLHRGAELGPEGPSRLNDRRDRGSRHCGRRVLPIAIGATVWGLSGCGGANYEGCEPAMPEVNPLWPIGGWGPDLGLLTDD
jgi:hypothetical protein